MAGTKEMINRRGFLSGLASLIIAPPIIEEVAKGKSFLSLYSPNIIIPSYDFVIANELERVGRHLPKLFDRDDVFFRIFNEQPTQYISERIMRIPLIIEPKNKAQSQQLSRLDLLLIGRLKTSLIS